MSSNDKPTIEEDPVAWVKTEWEKSASSLAEQRRNYWLNLAFFEGDQWVVYNPSSREVVEFPRARDDDRVRATANRIQPNIVNLLAKFMRRELGFEVPASAADDSAVTGARLSEHVLEATYEQQMWAAVRIQTLLNTFLGGTGGIALEWDPTAGEQLSVDPENGKVIGTGELTLSSLSIAEFALEPGSMTHRDARYWIRCQEHPPLQVQERWNLDYEPESDATATAGSIQAKTWLQKGYTGNVPLTRVWTYYERPTRANPRGRHIEVVGDRPVVDEKWPLPFTDRLNLFPFVQTPKPGKWFGHTIVTDAVPLQAMYNHFLSLMQEHMKHVAIARMAIPDSSGVDVEDLSDKPGEAFTYDGEGSQAPHWIQPPSIDRWVINHGAELKDRIDDQMYVHDISRGEAPGDRNSGLALSVLAEKDETPMAVMSDNIAMMWGDIGSAALEIYEKKAIEPRTAIVITKDHVPIQRKWTGIMLAGQTRARVPLQNVMPHSKAAMQAWVMDMIQKSPQAFANLNPTMLARLLDLPNVSMFEDMADPDAAQAQRENALMASGEIPSLGEKPFPMPWDNHAVHIAEHNRFRKSSGYINASPEVRMIVDMHCTAHERMNLEQVRQQQTVNATEPGMGALPQADAPPGAMVPLPSGQANPTGAPANGIPPAAPQAGPQAA